MPEATEDVFSLFSPTDIRRARDNSIGNIETLIHNLVSRLRDLKHHRAFPHPEVAPERHALNCIRVLTRVLPFLYEAENLESWRERIFWEKRRRPAKRKVAKKSEVLFDEARQQDPPELDTEEQFEDMQPLGEELVDTLADLLFYTDFTLPANDRTRNKVTYSIWQIGVGCNTHMNSSSQLESNRCEVLRLLLTMSSEALYMSPSMFAFPVSKLCGYLCMAGVLPVKGIRAVTYLTTCPDKQVVLSLLCSQLNTVRSHQL